MNRKNEVSALLSKARAAEQKGDYAASFFNLGSALALVQTIPPGVYIAMSGRVFPWDKAKNRDHGLFEAAQRNSPLGDAKTLSRI